MAVYLIAHDIGTSGNKATLFSEDGRMIANTVGRYPLYSDGNRAEQDANDWWRAVCMATRELLKKSAVSPDDIAAVSFSGQMMGCLPIDREGRPLRRAIIWADRRADQQVAQIREKMDDAHFFSIAGHRNISSYGMQKAMWIQSQEPEVYENTWKFLNAKDYIVLKMTGKCLTDVSDANGMECFDLKALKWSDELVACSGLDGDKLPEVVPSTHAVGHVTAQAAQETGLSEKTMVVMGAGDGVAANVGAGSVTPGNVYCCIGTSAWLAATTEQPLFDPERRMMCWAHAVPGLYSPNGTMQYAGGSYAWLKNTICTAEVEKAEREGISPYQVIEQEIEKVEIKDEVSDVQCDQCGAMMVYKMGRFGRFLACPNFPECRNTKPILNYLDVPCPKCGKRLLEKVSRKNRKFYGCEGYPECDFVSWDRPVARKCPKCGSYMVEKQNSRRGRIHLCANEACRYRETIENSEEEND